MTDYTPEFLTRLLEEMLLIRRFEEKAAQMYGLGKIGGFCHIYIGQEAVCTGATAAIDLAADYVMTAYRDHGHAISTGMDPKVVMAELFGKITGCSRGKGGSMHLFDVDRHFYGGHGIVGAHIPGGTLGYWNVQGRYEVDFVVSSGQECVAIEIKSRYEIPSERFVRMAKDAGVKFSLGSNQHGKAVANLGFCVEMARKVGLTREHIFAPAPAGSKPIEVRMFG